MSLTVNEFIREVVNDGLGERAAKAIQTRVDAHDSGHPIPAGGATNTVLAKTSNADYATAWVALPADTDVWPVTAKTTDFTAADQHVYLVDATAGDVAITVPHAAASRCLVVRVDSAAHTVTLTPDSGDIDGSFAFVTLNTAGAALHLVGDGTNVWRLNPAVGGDTTFRNLTIGVGGVGLLNVTDDLLHSGDAAGFFGHAVHAQPAAIANATDAGSAITQLNLALAALRDLGLIAT